MTIDPFTRASASYQAAIRHPHKSGSAFEGYSPAPIWPRVAVLVFLAIFAAILITL